MLDSSKYKDKKISEIRSIISEQPLYKELLELLAIKIEEDFMSAELILEQIIIGKDYVKILDPSVKLLDFFKQNGYSLHTLLPAQETENYKTPVVAWLSKS